MKTPEFIHFRIEVEHAWLEGDEEKLAYWRWREPQWFDEIIAELEED